MRKQFLKFLPLLAITGSIFINSCGNGDSPEGLKSRQKGDPCDKVNLCLSGLVCEGGFCRVVCNGKDDCGPKEHCENNRCVANLSDACPTGFTGDLCDQCLPEYWGKDCQPCECSVHGKCNAGLTGDGSCTCDKGWEGENCSTESNCPEGFGGVDGKDCDNCLKNHYGDYCKPCNCQHGDCWDGKSGNGQCKAASCAIGWDGPNCSKCADNYATKNCVLPDCKNGTPNLGLDGDGHCSECYDDWSGTDCDLPQKCVNGTPNIGVKGNGECSSCAEGWDGPYCNQCADGYAQSNCVLASCKNGKPKLGLTEDGHCSECNDKWEGTDCDVCPAGYYDGVNNCVDCRKQVTGSAFGTDKCTYSDKRIGETVIYKVVTIGDQTWMAENLKATKDINGNSVTCYANTDKDTDFVKKYGCLYVWSELATLDDNIDAENTNRICPKGWHLPESSEFQTLLDNTKTSTDSSNIRASSWSNGSDFYGFGALPAGNRYNVNVFDSFDSYAYFWSATSFSSDNAVCLLMNSNSANRSLNAISTALSVRCLKDSKQK